jgi:hypothetical protein
MKHSLLILLTLAATMAAGCTGSNSTATITTPATTTTDTFTGTVAVGGSDFKTFTVAQTGTINVTLTAAGPPPTIFMGLGVGTPSLSACALTSGNTTITPAGTTAQLPFSSVAPGSYCVQVYDVGNQTAPVTYSVTVAHT